MTESTERDYRDTIFLPKTDFPMRGNLPEREPAYIARWQDIDIYNRCRKIMAGAEPYVLHDGPPYANGNLHIGHAINKVLKDVIVRSWRMMGRDARYVPGWDCHGLPIEWKIEEEYISKGQSKDDVPILQLRDDCRNFAAKWVETQSVEFQRLGVMGDWHTPYKTMDIASEARIAEELHKFLLNGGLYRGERPVMWSTVEKTALSDAEVEYHDHKSIMVWVRFPVTSTSFEAVDGAQVVIWTTTPWTLPANRAICFGAEIDYVCLKVMGIQDGGFAKLEEVLVLAEALVEDVCKRVGVKDYKITSRFKGKELAETVCAHPWRGQGYDFDVPLLAGEHVTTEQGTGLVHTAPGHGEDDFHVMQAAGYTSVPKTVDDDGRYYSNVPLWAGEAIFEVGPKIITSLKEAGKLLAKGNLTHSYPHSWRSKAPLIWRTTTQWFISMETNTLRETALEAIDKTSWYPRQGYNRIRSMVADRPDWCVSRQRAWGVPIAIFVDHRTGEPLKDREVCARIVSIFREEGSDAWFSRPASDFLGPNYDPSDYEQITDIVDVWFESGCTHSFVLEDRGDGVWPADLYLEGSDQHRGWFHSSLLEACGTRGQAPYKTVLTHGFALDAEGRKMSKSVGNIVSPQDIEAQYGADILRLWVLGSDYFGDMRIGKAILKSQVDIYRRLRNTLRYLLGALTGQKPAASESMHGHATLPSRKTLEKGGSLPELECYILHRLHELDAHVRQCVQTYDFSAMLRDIHEFCASDLSSFFFDIRKDRLYCDALDMPERKGLLLVFEQVFVCLTAWLANVICFTAEEAWLTWLGMEESWNNPERSVHFRCFPDIPDDWSCPELATRWEKIRNLRRIVTGAIEVARREGQVKASLEADVRLYVNADSAILLKDVDMTTLCIASHVEVTDAPAPSQMKADAKTEPYEGVAYVTSAGGDKCERCWAICSEIDSQTALCKRCTHVLTQNGRH